MTKATDSPQPPEALARWYTRYSSPVGVLYLAARADAIVGIWYEDQAHFPLPHELGGLIENPDAYLREHGVAVKSQPVSMLRRGCCRVLRQSSPSILSASALLLRCR